MVDDSVEPPVLKRKRISVACNSCRTKKSKVCPLKAVIHLQKFPNAGQCDGKRPVCGRCAGYDYRCSWGDGKLPRDESCTPPRPSLEPHDAMNSEDLFEKYQQAIRSLVSNLESHQRNEVEKSLACVEAHLFPRSSSDAALTSPNCDSGNSPALIRRLQSPMYVGEVSDIHFFNLVRQTAAPCDRGHAARDDDEEEVDNYDTEAPSTMDYLQNPLSDIPNEAQRDCFLGIYFSTIHVAYPFVEEAPFKAKLGTLQAGELDAELTHSWLSLLCKFYHLRDFNFLTCKDKLTPEDSLLAIGAYYDSFLVENRQEKPSHSKLFQRSLLFSRHDMLERSLTQISALLAQCFYLLATSEIDRCWAHLGLAIRLAQSIGLHVDVREHGPARSSDQSSIERPELRGRAWYSLYVLDRLTALQLGRPPAISDHDCHVSIPSHITGLDPEITDGDSGSELRTHGSLGDYFGRVIEFSSIIGRVLRECYHPRRNASARLRSTKECDALLLGWRQNLPRFLRFDLGHAFDKSVTLKRQRNMLAIKFHHLRALIHRPYLLHTCVDKSCLPSEQECRSQEYGKICALEAQSIARLMHHVVDTMDIVMNYPWWQMISCLVCSGSIMVMASALLRQTPDNEASVATLDEDVETCMDVLKALSANSRGSKLAWDMMNNIRRRCASSDVMSKEASASSSLSRLKVIGDQAGQALSQAAFCGVPDNISLPFIGAETAPATVFPMDTAAGMDFSMGFGESLMWPMMMPSAAWPDSFADLFQGSHPPQDPD